ncbi:unnamed protein product, partial [Ixodes pacificus]
RRAGSQWPSSSASSPSIPWRQVPLRTARPSAGVPLPRRWQETPGVSSKAPPQPAQPRDDCRVLARPGCLRLTLSPHSTVQSTIKLPSSLRTCSWLCCILVLNTFYCSASIRVHPLPTLRSNCARRTASREVPIVS